MKMSDLQKKVMLSKLPPMPPISLSGGSSGKRPIGRKRDYTPVTWNKYFESKEDVCLDEKNHFRVYQCGKEGPVCFFLHGAGFSALSFAMLSASVTDQVECRCAAIDLRGHGDTVTENEEDLSADTLANDVGKVVKKMYGESPPPIILVGHSMGGALAVHVAIRDLIPSLIGLAVIDVVEGTALEALNSMQSFLRGRPSLFRSLEHAIEWCIRSGHIRNLDSAKVSMVGQLKRLDTNETATVEMSGTSLNNHTSSNPYTIQEEDEDGGLQSKQTQPQSSVDRAAAEGFRHPANPGASDNYTWRIDLARTEKHWRGWFEGLSKNFLSCPQPKLLLIAGVDRLDRDLTVGQMQGKFQMQVLPQSGHAVHEDVPDKVADVLATFMVRHRVAQATSNFNRTFPAC